MTSNELSYIESEFGMNIYIYIYIYIYVLYDRILSCLNEHQSSSILMLSLMKSQHTRYQTTQSKFINRTIKNLASNAKYTINTNTHDVPKDHAIFDR